MKTMKKLVSLIMALAMVMALAVSASAAGTKPGSIIIQNASKGATYEIYKLFDAKLVSDKGLDADGKGIVYTGTVPSELNEYFTANANGEITAVKDLDLASEAVQKALADWTESATPTDSKPGEGGPLTFNVDYGYYVITSTIGGGAVITVDSTTPNAEVYDKNSAGVPTFPTNEGKTVGDKIVELGETATYTIKLNTVNWVDAGTNAKQVLSYTITDNFADGKLTDVKDVTVKVKQTGKTDVTLNGKTFDNNGSMTIDWVNNATDKNSLYDNGAQIEITYTATVAAAGTVTNTVSATYKLDNDTTPSVENPPSANVYNAQMKVTKVDGNGKALADAGFVIQRADKRYYQINADSSDVAWVESIDQATELTTKVVDDVAEVTFVGLAEGTYTLIEKTVPTGYNKADDKTFSVTDTGADSDLLDANLKQTVTVENLTGAELPETGGIGTTIFTVAGSVMMIGAAILYITKKRSEDCAN